MARSSDGDAPHVLLVEDEPGDVRLVREAFEGGEVDGRLHVVRDGVEAIQFLSREGEYGDAPRPALVLLDLHLPRKNGDDVLEEIRADDALRPIPVVMLTVSGDREDVVRTYDRSVNAYVTKPSDPDEFIEGVQSIAEFWLSKVQLPTC